jgi:hypothetical protein
VLFIPEQSGEGLVVRPMKSFAFMQGFFDFYTSRFLLKSIKNSKKRWQKR